MPEVHWNGDDIAVLNGSINGSCIATGNPCPEAKVIIPNPCNYQTKLVITDSYTVRVEFKITNITEDCQEIYCYISNHQGSLFSKTLTIILPANSSIDDNGHNNTVPPEGTTVTAVPTNDKPATNSNVTKTDDIDYDSHSSGNVVTMDTCVLCVALVSVLLYIVSLT